MPYDDMDDEVMDDEWVDDDPDGGSDDDCLLVCPLCRARVHEDTQQCPSCGDWITPAHPISPWNKLVWIVAASMVILALLLAVVF